MNIKTTSHFDKRLSKRIKRNFQLRKKVARQLELMIININHPSLKLHKLKGKRVQEYSIWIEDNLRITFQIYKDDIILTDVVTHDEY